MPPNFLVYGGDGRSKVSDLKKVNSQRRALSQPTFVDVPVLTKGEVLYIPEGQMDRKPASCYRCTFYNYGRSCKLIGPNVKIRKFVYPPEATSDAKQIEYWPCCGMWTPGDPNYGTEKFMDQLSSADTLGLGWINAPKPGQEYGGANCGGKSGGDDCDHYCSEGDDKRAEPTAFCRVLQSQVENGAVCAAWRDDDFMTWDLAQNIMKELDDTQ